MGVIYKEIEASHHKCLSGLKPCTHYRLADGIDTALREHRYNEEIRDHVGSREERKVT